MSFQAALANVVAIATQLEKQYPDTNRDQGASLSPLNDVLVGDIRPILLVLLSGAGLLLLIAGVNVTGLVLVRSESRKCEFAVRTALGASTGKLTSQFVTEALVLTAAGGTLGLACAQWAIQLLKGLVSPAMMARTPFLRELSMNERVMSVAGAIALGAALLLSLAPSLQIRSSELRANLAEASRGSAGTTWRRLGSKLVAIGLAICDGLVGRSRAVRQKFVLPSTRPTGDQG